MARDPSVSEFINKAQAEIRERQSMVTALEAQVAGLAKRMGEENQRITQLRESISIAREIMDIIEPVEAISRRLFADSDVPQGSVAQMSYEIVKAHGTPMKVGDIARRLIAAGKYSEHQYRSAYAAVFGMLSKDKRFKKTDQPAEFAIREPTEQPKPSEQSLAAAKAPASQQEPSHP